MRLLPVGFATLCVVLSLSATAQPGPALADRIEGLLVGALVGDAAGGPDEFQPARRSVWTRTDTVLTAAGRAELARRFRLTRYTRPPEPYAHWRTEAGSITDDSRFKILFFNSLEAAGRPDRDAFARAILAFHADTTGPYGSLPRQWLDEFAFAARWVLDGPDAPGARPPERSWGGIPTMAGQMPFLPIAALHPGDPEEAYRTVWRIDFLDNGIGRDLNAALVAGLAAALDPGADWAAIEAAMRATDPYGFGDIPWVPRRLDLWLDRAHDAADRADGRAARLFEILEAELDATTWWEAWVPMTVVFACADLARHDPLATMQLILEFGHDTDSYLQVAGALFGALHGKDVFPEAMRAQVEDRLRVDYGADIDRWMRLLGAER